MDCNKFNENISYYVDGILNDSEKKEFEIHLTNCIDCKNKYNEMINIIQSLNDIEEVPLPDNYDKILREKLEKERDQNNKKSNWTKYLFIVASVTIIAFSVHVFNNAQKIDNIAQENIDIKEEISIASNDESEVVEDKNLNTEQKIVKKSNVKQNKDYKRNEQEVNKDKNDINIATFEAKESKIKNEKIEKNVNQIGLLPNNVEPAVFRLNTNLITSEEKVVTIGDIITVDLPQAKGTEYSLICNDENNIVELISESIEKRDNDEIHTWKFKTLKEGKLTIEFKQYKKDSADEIYKVYRYDIITK
ncbi:zf-HC2 domain-containing protein [Tepidibacter formicigenes]|jgi:hypothetical protein|uniref:Zinc-finger n=1 Tax=Tepidibacter formicigenes DSM 15518 TaxID=1123349 RepID=A0A1M6MWZ8_9FIRM|nr:zf-HC2 domain-containing protein [Tepidibacter formicigenes]SHJ87997.1 hypothetical protein SAMN02744037_01088 [Tepidibacter formicigenes DSM 15518]